MSNDNSKLTSFNSPDPLSAQDARWLPTLYPNKDIWLPHLDKCKQVEQQNGVFTKFVDSAFAPSPALIQGDGMPDPDTIEWLRLSDIFSSDWSDQSTPAPAVSINTLLEPFHAALRIVAAQPWLVRRLIETDGASNGLLAVHLFNDEAWETTLIDDQVISNPEYALAEYHVFVGAGQQSYWQACVWLHRSRPRKAGRFCRLGKRAGESVCQTAWRLFQSVVYTHRGGVVCARGVRSLSRSDRHKLELLQIAEQRLLLAGSFVPSMWQMMTQSRTHSDHRLSLGFQAPAGCGGGLLAGEWYSFVECREVCHRHSLLNRLLMQRCGRLMGENL